MTNLSNHCAFSQAQDVFCGQQSANVIFAFNAIKTHLCQSSLCTSICVFHPSRPFGAPFSQPSPLLFVGNVSAAVQRRDLERVFAPFGALQSVNFFAYRRFALVGFVDAAAAVRAREHYVMTPPLLCGKRVIVNYAGTAGTAGAAGSAQKKKAQTTTTRASKHDAPADGAAAAAQSTTMLESATMTKTMQQSSSTGAQTAEHSASKSSDESSNAEFGSSPTTVAAASAAAAVASVPNRAQSTLRPSAVKALVASARQSPPTSLSPSLPSSSSVGGRDAAAIPASSRGGAFFPHWSFYSVNPPVDSAAAAGARISATALFGANKAASSAELSTAATKVLPL